MNNATQVENPLLFNFSTGSCRCERCGMEIRPHLPIPVRTFCDRMETFIERHEHCQEEIMEENLNHYRVHIRSVPGMYEQYSGSVAVWAKDEEDATSTALMKLKRGAFPDRDATMWQVVKIEEEP